MATQPDFLPCAPGVYANGINPDNGAVSHHLVLGFQKGEPVLYPPLTKGHAFAIQVGPHAMYCPQLGREASDINNCKALLGAPS